MHIDIEFHKMLTGMVRTNCLSSKKDIMECNMLIYNNTEQRLFENNRTGRKWVQYNPLQNYICFVFSD